MVAICSWWYVAFSIFISAIIPGVTAKTFVLISVKDAKNGPRVQYVEQDNNGTYAAKPENLIDKGLQGIAGIAVNTATKQI